MTRQTKILIIVMVVLFGGIFAWNVVGGIMMRQYFANFQPPPVTISSAKAEAKDWYPHIQAVGTIEAVNGVDVSAEVNGMVETIHFDSGQEVNQGELLIRLNDDIDQADLKNQQARFKLARASYDRDRDLFKKNATSKSALDKAEAELMQAEAFVERTQALIDKKNIKAPFSGKLGIRQINIGQNIQAGTPIVNIQSLNPLHVLFSLPEQRYKALYVGQSIKMAVEAYEDRVFNAEVIAINSKIDEHTRNISVLGSVNNDENLLYPGMFADVVLSLPQKRNVVTVPQTAISYNLYGDSIFVINEEGFDEEGAPILKTYRKYVKVGRSQSSEVEIIDGLKAGELIVTSGQLKLNDGNRVIINNAVHIH